MNILSLYILLIVCDGGLVLLGVWCLVWFGFLCVFRILLSKMEDGPWFQLLMKKKSGHMVVATTDGLGLVQRT